MKSGSWQKETIDSKGDVGEESGNAIDNKGIVHISYIDVTNGALKYAKKEGSLWNIQTLDRKSGYNVVTTSIALDSNDYPHIVYNMESEDGEFVKYAFWDGSSWDIETISSRGGIDVYLALDSNDNPHISFVKQGYGDKEQIHYDRKISEKWKVEIADSTTTSGGDSGIDVDSNNYPHIAYHDYSKGAIKYAKWDGTSWGIQTIATDVGSDEGLRMVLDVNTPHIGYDDNKKEMLMYATWDGKSWVKETVDRMGIPSIAVDYLGRRHVAHGYTVDEETNDEGREILKYSIRE